MLWLWVLPFVLQALLLGIIMYTVRRCRRCSHCRFIAEGSAARSWWSSPSWRRTR
jgi:hypothetical protein